MNIEELQSICRKLKGRTEDIKWENHLCFNISGKMFLITSPDSVPVSASFKVADEEFEELSSRKAFSPRHILRVISGFTWMISIAFRKSSGSFMPRNRTGLSLQSFHRKSKNRLV
jgi:hypothetical protein